MPEMAGLWCFLVNCVVDNRFEAVAAFASGALILAGVSAGNHRKLGREDLYKNLGSKVPLSWNDPEGIGKISPAPCRSLNESSTKRARILKRGRAKFRRAVKSSHCRVLIQTPQDRVDLRKRCVS